MNKQLKELFALPLLILSLFATAQEPDQTKVAALFQDQLFEEALSYLQPFEKGQENNIRLLSSIGYTYFMLEKWNASKNYYQRILKIEPDNISALRYLASLTANKEPDSTILLNKRLIVLKPEIAAFHRNLGEGYRRVNKHDSALTAFNQAYLLQPNDLKNGAALADLLIFQRNYSRADSILENGLQLDSMNSNFLRLRIKSAYQSEDYKSAIVPGERLMRTDELSSIALSQLALAYYNLKLYQDSYRVSQFMLDSGFELEAVYYNQAKAAAKLKNFAVSNTLLDTCLQKAISNTAEMYLYTKAQNYEAIGQFKKAISNYDTAYYLFRDPRMMYYIASIYESDLKDMKQATKYYSKYLSLARPKTADEIKAYEYVKKRLSEKVEIRRDGDSTVMKEEEE